MSCERHGRARSNKTGNLKSAFDECVEASKLTLA